MTTELFAAALALAGGGHIVDGAPLPGLPFVCPDSEGQQVVPERLLEVRPSSLLWLGVTLLRYPDQVIRLPQGELDVAAIAALRDGLTSLGYRWRPSDGGVALHPKQSKRGPIRIDTRHTPTPVAALLLLAAALDGPVVEIQGLGTNSELVELALLLNQFGARVTGVGTPVAYVEGGALLGSSARPGRDRQEALYLLIASALFGSFVVHDVPSHRMVEELHRLGRTGLTIKAKAGGLVATGTPGAFDLEVKDDPRPFVLLAVCAEGASVLSGPCLGNAGSRELVGELVRLGVDLLARGELLYIGGGPARAPQQPVGLVQVTSAGSAMTLLLLGCNGLLPGLVVEVMEPIAATAVARFASRLGCLPT